ncbi:50S ribosomal protein L13 [Streptococcus infantis SK1302]|uniref:50S ribosomal protein L13 n=1 Tax=Streptococcus infantis SK1302 TaxID=871237 RepID=A0ABN0B762_9STRE|nr:50S ribosomal protein L13 [Streptococcus infantis SK1302]
MNKTTFMAKPGQVERKWYVVDATDVPLGRLSAVVASVLRGKTNQHSHHTLIQVTS